MIRMSENLFSLFFCRLKPTLSKMTVKLLFVFLLSRAVAKSGVVHYPQEKHLANVRQLTWGGMNAEAYFR